MRRVLAWIYGLSCHAAFALAVTLMIRGLYTGLQSGGGTLAGVPAWAANLLLTLQFPLIHSYLLTRRGQRLLVRLAPRRLGEQLSTTTYAGIASLQVLLVFALWSPSGMVLWSATGSVRVLMTLLYAASWLLVARAIYDAGLALQTGALGWISVVRGRQPRYPQMPVRGLFRVTRQPIYLGFAMTLWTGPELTLDRLLLAVPWTAHCVLGPLLKERRYARQFGGAFSEYRARVPYFLPYPHPRREPRGRESG